MLDWDLIAKYHAGETTAEERQQVDQWLDAHPEEKSKFMMLAAVVKPVQHKLNSFDDTRDQDWESIRKITESENNAVTRRSTLWLKVAASLLLIAIASFTLLDFNHKTDALVYQATDSVRYISLADGSHVWLNKNSTLTVDEEFNTDDRQLSLTGEAYFEVAKNQNKPFFVNTSTLQTRVVGTAFDVLADPNHFEITVTEGKVRVAKNGSDSVFLFANETMLYKNTDHELRKQPNTDLNYLAWKTGILRFEDAKLQDVVSELSKFYDRNIQLQGEPNDNHRITTELNNLSPNDAMEVITSTLGLELTQRDSLFIIKVE